MQEMLFDLVVSCAGVLGTANPTFGDFFEELFQSSKLKARTSLFTKT